MPAQKHIVITGVTRGIGRALTEKFIALGHTVSGCGRTKAEILALSKANPAPHDFAVVDVADPAQTQRWAEAVIRRAGAPDLLINNAALMNKLAPLWMVPADEFSRLMDVNVKGVAQVIRGFVPAMIARGTGVIVNFSSGWGQSVSPGVAPYCTTKWAIEGLTKALAAELPAGLAAVPFKPGCVDTDMLRSCFGEGAADHPKAKVWAEKAAPFLLKLGANDNGRLPNWRESKG